MGSEWLVLIGFGGGVSLTLGVAVLTYEIDKWKSKNQGLTYADMVHAKEEKELTESRRPKLVIKGVPKDLEFTLVGFESHLAKGGLVRMEFNADGTHMEVRPSFKSCLGGTVGLE